MSIILKNVCKNTQKKGNNFSLRKLAISPKRILQLNLHNIMLEKNPVEGFIWVHDKGFSQYQPTVS
jgi:hypothetical protein